MRKTVEEGIMIWSRIFAVLTTPFAAAALFASPVTATPDGGLGWKLDGKTLVSKRFPVGAARIPALGAKPDLSDLPARDIAYYVTEKTRGGGRRKVDPPAAGRPDARADRAAQGQGFRLRAEVVRRSGFDPRLPRI